MNKIIFAGGILKKHILPADYKCCATCQHWEGTRTLTNDRNNVHFDAENHGKCCSAQSFCSNQGKKGKDICIYWTKWYRI